MDAEETLSSRRVFDGKIVGVRVDTVRLPDGRQATREVVEHRPDVAVVAIDDEDQVLLVRQYRYPIVQDLLEAPAGIVEQGESREACAQRELREETGYRGTRMESLGRFWMSPGHSTELMHAFLARDLRHSPLSPDEDEVIQTERVPLSQVNDLIRGGEIQDAKTIAALLMASGVLGGAEA